MSFCSLQYLLSHQSAEESHRQSIWMPIKRWSPLWGNWTQDWILKTLEIWRSTSEGPRQQKSNNLSVLILKIFYSEIIWPVKGWKKKYNHLLTVLWTWISVSLMTTFKYCHWTAMMVQDSSCCPCVIDPTWIFDIVTGVTKVMRSWQCGL